MLVGVGETEGVICAATGLVVTGVSELTTPQLEIRKTKTTASIDVR